MNKQAVGRPNILLLHTDQQRFDTIAAQGASHVRTPNLDRLVRQGTSFTKAYSSCPVCQPARHDLITGVSARHHGYHGNRPGPIADYGLPTIPRLLLESGYQTLAVGKMHFWPERAGHGFAHTWLMEELPSCREDDAYVQYLEDQGLGELRCQHGVRPLFYHTPQAARVPEEHHGSAWVAHKTIELMREHRDRPFFLFASWVGPHPPFYVPQKYLDQYVDSAVPQPCGPTDWSSRQSPVSPENPDPQSERMRAIQRSYYAAITFIDLQIGKVLDSLEELGLAETTTVIFTTDHGEMLGDLGTYQKHVPYEGSAHIPLIVRGKGFEPGTRCEVPVTTWDTSATILRTAGVEAPPSHPLIGAYLGDIAGSAGERGKNERMIAFHHGDGQHRYVAATNGRYKFVHWYNGGQEELYDLAADPWEQVNILSKDSATAEMLRKACIRFESDHGQVQRVQDGRFVDLDYRQPHPHASSLYPLWSSFQFPPWTETYTEKDLELIAAEMAKCLKNEFAYICREAEWREHALKEWEKIGGKRQVYLDLFDAADGRKRHLA